LAIINGSVECLDELLGGESEDQMEKINWNLYEERGFNSI
jgi:hypothetical protein